MSITMSPLAAAIASAEGYGASSTNVPTRANNPGDLALGDIGFGTTGAGITIFPTLQDGVNALEHQVSLMTSGGSSVYSPSQSIASAATSYAGPSGASSWASNVASALGVPSSATLGSLASKTGSSVLSALTGGTSNLFTSGLNVEDYVLIIVGIVLIAAGVFAFKSAQTIISVAGQHVKGAAKAAAEIAA